MDGTRIKAMNSAGRNFTHAKLQRELKRIDERLEQYPRLLQKMRDVVVTQA